MTIRMRCAWRAVFWAAVMGCFAVWPVRACAFDCLAPPFGERMDRIEGREQLREYAHSGDLAYYRYEGPCGYAMPARISYAFVDGALFARIIEAHDVDFEAVKKLAPEAYGKKPKETRDGPWTVLTWNFRDRDMKLKIKYDASERRLKSALYYEPLRERLRAIAAQREIFETLAKGLEEK